MNSEPAYLKSHTTGRLKDITDELRGVIRACALCPHRCGVDRMAGERGKCRSGPLPVVSSFHAHFGEERPLVGRGGSGTIFLTNCNLACIFCQNYDISHYGRGDEVSFDELAAMMLALQAKGCHNINFVSPSHMLYSIVEALLIAVPRGLSLPLVYNTGGYDSANIIHLIDGVFDIYMPDFKFMDASVANELSDAPDYPERAMEAVAEMHRQVGDLELDDRGIARRGLLVRHLVLPNNIARTDAVLDFLAGLSRDTYVNIMDQYRPEYRARECFDLRRRVTLQEFDAAVAWARKAGLRRIDGV